MEDGGGRRDGRGEIHGGRLTGEALFDLGSVGRVDHRDEQMAGAPRRIVMKSGAGGIAARHAAGAAMMLAVAAAAGGQIEFRRHQNDWSDVAPEKDDQDEIGQRAPHRC